MKQPPAIVIQLIHIEGPMKGQIQEFNQPEVTIGRHASCDVCFPKDLAIVSRHHARIVREGNRFMLMDQSSNGSFVNGKQVKESILKDGDVLLFSEGGPKVSFLTQMVEGGVTADIPAPPVPRPAVLPPSEPTADIDLPPPVIPPQPIPVPKPAQPPVSAVPVSAPSPPAEAPAPPAHGPVAAPPRSDISIQQVKKPLVVQFGPTLQSFHTLPVVIGSGGNCDFKLAHPAIFERHAQIFYYQDNYWVKDLTGKGVIRINARPVAEQGMLEPDARLSLNTQGPDFIFLGGGRLAEIEPETVQPTASAADENSPDVVKPSASGKAVKELGAMMKRMLKR